MVPKSRTLRIAAVALVSVGSLVWGGGVVYASALSGDALDGQVVSVNAPTSFDDQPNFKDRSADASEADLRVLNYWTEERLNDAVSVDMIASNSSATREARPQIGQMPPQRVLSDPVLARAGLGQERSAGKVTNFSKVNGKVFFTNASDGRNYMCSGSALNSSSKRLVITAGHCVHGGKDGTWHKNWVFIPDYHHGQRPYGTFQAKTFRTFNAWMEHGEGRLGFERDVAFVTTCTNESGKKL